jgi:hypothetical protein
MGLKGLERKLEAHHERVDGYFHDPDHQPALCFDG